MSDKKLIVVGFVALALAIAGCGSTPELTSVPATKRELTVSPAAAASKINAYRAKKGLAPLVVDPALNRIAQQTADKLAAKDTMATSMHTDQGLMQRLDRAGYPDLAAAENLGAGYPTLDWAVKGWQGSKGHNKNLLNKRMTHMGIGLKVRGTGKWQSYWVLILAQKDGVPSS
ncbi:MAG: CAP domain-containing protein [Stappiaceae bacterium]